MLRPYNNEILNKFDGVVLQLIIFITALPLFDDFDSPLVITVAFVLFMIPMLNFIAITLLLNKGVLKKILIHLISKVKPPSSNSNDANNNEIHMREFDLIVDDNIRQNATVTICDM